MQLIKQVKHELRRGPYNPFISLFVLWINII